MSEHLIRAAQEEDIEALAACINAAYSIYRDRIEDLPDVSAGLMDALEEKVVRVVVSGVAIVGGMVLEAKPDYLILENIAVHPDHAGKGIGGLLIKNCEAECIGLGLTEIRLSTHKDMSENISLYQHLGWRITGSSGNKVHMSKNVGA